MPTLPKNPRTRQRRNRTAGASKLSKPQDVKIPDLPELPDGGEWSEMTRLWWVDIWSSPMSPEWDESDIHGLFRAAQLHEDFWTATSPTGRKDVSAELRLVLQRYGLDPFARRSLQWEIDRGDEAEERIAKRREAREAKAAPKTRQADPRRALHVVK